MKKRIKKKLKKIKKSIKKNTRKTIKKLKKVKAQKGTKAMLRKHGQISHTEYMTNERSNV